MKTLKLLGLGVLIGGMAFFTSCDKDSDLDSNIKTKVTKTDDDGDDDNPVEDAANVLFANALPTDLLTVGTSVAIRIDAEEILAGIGFREFSSYLPVNIGEVTVEAVLADGSVLATTNVLLDDNDIINVVLGINPLTQLPELNVQELLPSDLEVPTNIEDVLGIANGDAVGYIFNVLNLTAFDDDIVPVLGIEYIDGLGEDLGGLIELPSGDLTEMIFGAPGVLENLDLLGSELDFDDLISSLLSEGDVTDLLDLGGVLGLVGLDGLVGGLLDALSGILDGILGGIFGGNDNPLEMLSAGLFDNLPMAPRGIYTIVMVGDIGAEVELMIIDHNAAGLE